MTGKRGRARVGGEARAARHAHRKVLLAVTVGGGSLPSLNYG